MAARDLNLNHLVSKLDITVSSDWSNDTVNVMQLLDGEGFQASLLMKFVMRL